MRDTPTRALPQSIFPGTQGRVKRADLLEFWESNDLFIPVPPIPQAHFCLKMPLFIFILFSVLNLSVWRGCAHVMTDM